jgi:hypothetical protein
LQIEQRLIVHQQLVAFQGAVQFAFQREPLAGRRLHVGGKHLYPVLALLLGG